MRYVFNDETGEMLQVPVEKDPPRFDPAETHDVVLYTYEERGIWGYRLEIGHDEKYGFFGYKTPEEASQAAASRLVASLRGGEKNKINTT